MKVLIDPVNIICFILLSISMKIYMNIFFEKRKEGIIVWNYIAICTIYIGLSLFPHINPWVNILVVIILFFIYELILYTGKVSRIFFINVLWVSMGSLCEYIVFFIFSLSYKEKIIFSIGYYNYARLLSQCILVFFMLFLRRVISKPKMHKIRSQSNLILLLLAFATVMVDWGVYRIYIHPENATDDYYAVLIATIMMGMSIIIIKIYEGLGEKAELETRNMVYQTQVEAYRIQISEREEAVKEFRLLKHDMKNHLIYMEELIRQKKDEEVCKYIDELLNSRGLSQRGVVNSGNILVDGLINYKIPYMKSLNIDFQAEVTIPFDLRFPEDNLCIIIGNLLDNAIEGIQKIKESKRQIYLEMMLKKDNLFILIKNPCMEKSLMKKGSYFLTTKNDEDHGMGLLSVKRAVEECQGSLYINVEKGIFQVSVMFPKAENKPDREKK